MGITNKYDSAVVEAVQGTDEGQLLVKAKPERLTFDVQNQQATAKFWLSNNPRSKVGARLQVKPDVLIGRDFLTTTDDIYVWTDTPGAELMFIEGFGVLQ